MLAEHKEACLGINGTQSVKLEKRTTEFKDLFKQIQSPFKIYSDFECILESARASNMAS